MFIRKDVTDNKAKSFEELAASLRQDGFNVDHFHGMEIVNGEEMMTHFQEFDGKWDNNRQFGNDPQGWNKLVMDEYHE